MMVVADSDSARDPIPPCSLILTITFVDVRRRGKGLIEFLYHGI